MSVYQATYQVPVSTVAAAPTEKGNLIPAAVPTYGLIGAAVVAAATVVMPWVVATVPFMGQIGAPGYRTLGLLALNGAVAAAVLGIIFHHSRNWIVAATGILVGAGLVGVAVTNGVIVHYTAVQEGVRDFVSMGIGMYLCALAGVAVMAAGALGVAHSVIKDNQR
jgi:hypothetical protein